LGWLTPQPLTGWCGLKIWSGVRVGQTEFCIARALIQF
jgi:hypothetical protein